MLKPIVGLWLIAGATLVHAHDQARSLSPRHSLPRSDSAVLLHSTDPGADRFIAVGELQTRAPCTATLIAGPIQPPAERPALVLTAGHCAGSFGANDVLVDRAPANDKWQFTPGYFIDTQPQPSYPVQRIVYATMKQGDWAILQLGATYGELARRGVKPILLRETGGAPDSDIELTHIPSDGVPENERFLRLSTCRTGTTQAVFEGGDPWYWPEAMPNDCAGVAGGSSGSPVFLAGTRTLVGVLNTTVGEGLIGCGLNRPCELRDTDTPHPAAGTAPPTAWSREGASYANPVDRIAAALRPDGSLDVSALDRGDGVGLKRTPRTSWSTQSQVADDGGERHPAEWSLLVDEASPLVRFKQGAANAVDCDSPEGYGQPTPSANQPLLHLPVQSLATLPAQEGVYKLCAIAVDPVTRKAQDPRHATVLLHQIDDTPPTQGPKLTSKENQSFWWVDPLYRPYEITDIDVKYGPAAATDCHDPDGYEPYRHISLQLSKSEAPWRVCAKGYDYANNPSPIVSQDYQ